MLHLSSSPILDIGCGFEICLEDETRKDISTYVQLQLSAWGTPAILAAIQTAIAQHASGIFLWARLIIERILALVRKGVGWTKIKDEIYAIPLELDEFYQELLQGMGERQASRKLIQWICFATWPLSLDELRWAMIVDTDCPHKSLRQCQNAEDYVYDNNMMARRRKTLGCGLSETVQSYNRMMVQLIHQSVKDFFVHKGLSALDGPNWAYPRTE